MFPATSVQSPLQQLLVGYLLGTSDVLFFAGNFFCASNASFSAIGGCSPCHQNHKEATNGQYGAHQNLPKTQQAAQIVNRY
jgi:hypothetical protein